MPTAIYHKNPLHTKSDYQPIITHITPAVATDLKTNGYVIARGISTNAIIKNISFYYTGTLATQNLSILFIVQQEEGSTEDDMVVYTSSAAVASTTALKVVDITPTDEMWLPISTIIGAKGKEYQAIDIVVKGDADVVLASDLRLSFAIDIFSFGETKDSYIKTLPTY